MLRQSRLCVGALVWLASACQKSEAAPSLASASSASESAAASAPSSAPPPSHVRAKPQPAVTLSGESNPLPVAEPAPGRPRVYARALRAWIHERPSPGSNKLGYLRAGASSPTSDKAAGREGCKGGWYPVQPDGFVCVGQRATLDGNDPIV